MYEKATQNQRQSTEKTEHKVYTKDDKSNVSKIYIHKIKQKSNKTKQINKSQISYKETHEHE